MNEFDFALGLEILLGSSLYFVLKDISTSVCCIGIDNYSSQEQTVAYSVTDEHAQW